MRSAISVRLRRQLAAHLGQPRLHQLQRHHHVARRARSSSEISTAPRMVLERTRRTPSTGTSASSSGRVTLRSTISAVASGSVATTTTRGNDSSG